MNPIRKYLTAMVRTKQIRAAVTSTQGTAEAVLHVSNEAEDTFVVQRLPSRTDVGLGKDGKIDTEQPTDVRVMAAIPLLPTPCGWYASDSQRCLLACSFCKES